MRKRGILFDIPEFMVIVFAFASVALITYLVVDNLNTSFQANDSIPTEGKTFWSDLTNRWPIVFDGGVVTMFFLLVIVLLGLSWMVASNGITFLILWLVSMLFVAMGGFLANAWDAMTSSSALSAAATNFPLSNFLFSHYLAFGIVINFLMITIFFAKRQQEGSF
jgi:hypothetical protein